MIQTELVVPYVANLESGADPSIRDELCQADADASLRILFATRWHDPVTQRLHELIHSRTR